MRVQTCLNNVCSNILATERVCLFISLSRDKFEGDRIVPRFGDFEAQFVLALRLLRMRYRYLTLYGPRTVILA